MRQLWRVSAVLLALLGTAAERVGGGEGASSYTGHTVPATCASQAGPRPLCSCARSVGEEAVARGGAAPAGGRQALAAAGPCLLQLRGGGACIPVLKGMPNDDMGPQLLRAAALGNSHLVLDAPTAARGIPSLSLRLPSISRPSPPLRFRLCCAGAKAGGHGGGRGLHKRAAADAHAPCI